jgi:hypothetical protein
MNWKPRAGFSVPEILTAIGIIVVGNLVVMHACRQARQVARSSSCASNVKQLATALRVYAEDADGVMPPSPRAMAHLMVYTKNEQIFCCPTKTSLAWLRRHPEDKSVPAGDVKPNDYLCNPRARLDDPPGVILVGDDAPSRHLGRWNGARLDGAAFLWPADQWETNWGTVRSDDKPQPR